MLNRKLKKAQANKNVDLQYVNKRTPVWKPLLFLSPALVLIAVFTLYPFFTSVTRAFWNPVREGTISQGGHYGFDQFENILTNASFMHSFWNTIILAFVQLPITMTISIIVSAAISSLVRKWSRGTAQTVFFLPYVTSGIAIAFAFSLFFDPKSGLFNDWFGSSQQWLYTSDPNSFQPLIVIIINGVWGGLAFQILIFTTAMLSIEKDRYRAAAIDGAGPIRSFFRITLPSINSTTNFIITIGLINAIRVFPLALYDNKPGDALANGAGTLMLYVYNAIQPQGSAANFELGAAASIILVVISIVFSVVTKNTINAIVKLSGKVVERNVTYKIKKYSIKK